MSNVIDTLLAVSHVTGSSGGGGAILITKTVTANGDYAASADSADGYSSVTVNVDNTALARSILDKTIVEYIDPGITTLRAYAFAWCSSLQRVVCHGVSNVGMRAFDGTNVDAIALPSPTLVPAQWALAGIKSVIDLGCSQIGSNGCTTSAATTLVLRKSDAVVAIMGTGVIPQPFQSGKAGGTVYIPKALYDHLGDGTALDYKAATNWSTLDGYGTITWAQIEGSVYETQYADGTPIPTT